MMQPYWNRATITSLLIMVLSAVAVWSVIENSTKSTSGWGQWVGPSMIAIGAINIIYAVGTKTNLKFIQFAFGGAFLLFIPLAILPVPRF